METKKPEVKFCINHEGDRGIREAWCVFYDGKVYPFLEEPTAEFAAKEPEKLATSYFEDTGWEESNGVL